MLQSEYRELAAEYAQLVRQHFGDRLCSICFFGSAVRGGASPESDLDALIVVNDLPQDVGLRVRETAPIHEAVRRTEAYRGLRMKGRSGFISDIYLTPVETRSHPPILLDIADHGELVYDRGGVLEAELKKIRERLVELGARKVAAKKGYYWILKPDANPAAISIAAINARSSIPR